MDSMSSSQQSSGVTTESPTGNLTLNFRAKIVEMKNWKPLSTPSNRDRLEIYALHKQAVSGDATFDNNTTTTTTTSLSPAERAKIHAWRSKRGLSQSQAMTAYIVEANRQLRVYGTASSSHTTTASEETTTTTTPLQRQKMIQTPTNTPLNDTSEGEDASHATTLLLTPRGIAAVPLLCAACSEPRTSYLLRLSSTGSPMNGWWRRQEPLCVADPHSIFALPEILLLYMASKMEWFSLTLSSDTHVQEWIGTLGIRPAVVQSLLWPLHHMFLVIWILIVFISTWTGSAWLMAQTMLWGSQRTGTSLQNLFSEDIHPCRLAAGSLCCAHQAITVRMLGLALYPLGIICEMAESVRKNILSILGTHEGGGGVFVGSGIFVLASGFLWWYWFLVLPWMALLALGTALSMGWCFGLIELAGIL